MGGLLAWRTLRSCPLCMLLCVCLTCPLFRNRRSIHSSSLTNQPRAPRAVDGAGRPSDPLELSSPGPRRPRPLLRRLVGAWASSGLQLRMLLPVHLAAAPLLLMPCGTTTTAMAISRTTVPILCQPLDDDEGRRRTGKRVGGLAEKTLTICRHRHCRYRGGLQESLCCSVSCSRV